MSLERRSAMKDAISEVLETMFFVVVEFEGDTPSTTEAFSCQSRIRLFGKAATSTDLIFRITEGFARTLTANFLGKPEDEVLMADMEDTLKETANMVGGNFISRKIDGKWRLGIPYFVSGMDEPINYHGLKTLLFYCGELVGEVAELPFDSNGNPVKML